LPLDVVEKNTGLSRNQIEKAQNHINKIKDTTEYVRAAPPICYINR
jgi:NAD+ synthase